MDPNEEHALLAAVVAGEIGIDDAVVQALLAQRPGLRARLERMRELAQRLDHMGRAERADRESTAAPDDSRHDRVGVPVAAVQRRWPYGWLLAAAALLAIGWYATRVPMPQKANKDSMLGARGEVGPVGAVDALDVFHWNSVRPPEGTFILRFWEPGQVKRFLFAVPDLRESEWTPDAARKQLLQQRMEWTVETLDQQGYSQGTIGPFTVWLSH